MSWLARSIANTLKLNEEDDVDAKSGGKLETVRQEGIESKDDSECSPISPPSRGVKDDLSELSRTLTHQFRGFATFLAPPPQSEQKSESDVDGSDKGSTSGIRGDFAEIGGRFRSGITRLSNNINVSEITKMASNLLQLESDGENGNNGKELNSREDGPVGVTEEVLAFGSDIATHPETWLDFPLPLNDEDDDDFDMSDEQEAHALAVERLVPALAALRMELCPRYMSDDRFWKIYFVLVHTRLPKQDALILSTPQVMEARALLVNESRKQVTLKGDDHNESVEAAAASEHEKLLPAPISLSTKADVEKSPEHNISTPSITTSELQEPSAKKAEPPSVTSITMKEKDASEAGVDSRKNNSQKLISADDEDVDDWLRDETVGGTISNSTAIHNEDEDVSFSDLEEEEEDGDSQTNIRKSNYSSDDKDTRDWVQLGKSSSSQSSNKHSDTKESSDWLDVDDMIAS